jgi:hypothetical protein
MSSTVVLATKQHTTTPIIKPNYAKQYLEQLWTSLVGDLSFIVVVSFLFIPVCFTSFLFVYFGFVHGLLFVAAVCLYNYLESKYHPRGETKRKWDTFTNLIGTRERDKNAHIKTPAISLSRYHTYVEYLPINRATVGAICANEGGEHCKAWKRVLLFTQPQVYVWVSSTWNPFPRPVNNCVQYGTVSRNIVLFHASQLPTPTQQPCICHKRTNTPNTTCPPLSLLVSAPNTITLAPSKSTRHDKTRSCILNS